MYDEANRLSSDWLATHMKNGRLLPNYYKGLMSEGDTREGALKADARQ